MSRLYNCQVCGAEVAASLGVHPDFFVDIFTCDQCKTTQAEYVTPEALAHYYKNIYRISRGDNINERY